MGKNHELSHDFPDEAEQQLDVFWPGHILLLPLWRDQISHGRFCFG